MSSPWVKKLDVDRIRNLAIVAHINAGKTTLSERILVLSGRQRSFGEVDSGLATMDWRPEEQGRGISINAAVTQVAWRDHRIQLVDTPGHVDFAAEVGSSLRAVDAAIVVIDGVRGVEPQTESVWRRLDDEGLPRLVFVNKLDRPVADLDSAVRSIETRFQVRCAVLDRPLLSAAHELRGCFDLLGDEPSGDAVMDDARDSLFALLGEEDPGLFASFVEGRHPGRPALLAALRRATLARDLVPVLCGSALRDVGVQRLLDAVCDLLPTPRERGGPLGRALGSWCGDVDAKAAALVFSPSDPFGEHAGAEAGTPAVLARVFAGVIRVGDRLEGPDRVASRVVAIGSVHAADRERVAMAIPGEIVALQLDRRVPSGSTLRGEGSDLILEAARLPAPVLRAALEPERSEDRDELERVARRVAAFDHVVHIEVDAESRELKVEVMGELHLDVFRERLARAYRRPFRLGEPKVLRRAVARKVADGVGEVERTVDGLPSTARAVIRLEPAPDRGLLLRWAVPAADLSVMAAAGSDELRRELLTELESIARRGPLSGPPLTDCALELRGLAAEGAGIGVLLLEAVQLACEGAMRESAIVVQEPRVRVVAQVPADALGPVLADLNARNAAIEEVSNDEGRPSIRCSVALARILGWATTLRSRTRGMGTFTVWPDGWIDVQPA